jgi:hypothetical protein
MLALRAILFVSFAAVMFVPPAAMEIVVIDHAAGRPEHANRENRQAQGFHNIPFSKLNIRLNIYDSKQAVTKKGLRIFVNECRHGPDSMQLKSKQRKSRWPIDASQRLGLA